MGLVDEVFDLVRHDLKFNINDRSRQQPINYAAQSINRPLRFCCAADNASVKSEETNMAAFLAET